MYIHLCFNRETTVDYFQRGATKWSSTLHYSHRLKTGILPIWKWYPVTSPHGHFAPSHFAPTKSHFAPYSKSLRPIKKLLCPIFSSVFARFSVKETTCSFQHGLRCRWITKLDISESSQFASESTLNTLANRLSTLANWTFNSEMTGYCYQG